MFDDKQYEFEGIIVNTKTQYRMTLQNRYIDEFKDNKPKRLCDKK